MKKKSNSVLKTLGSLVLVAAAVPVLIVVLFIGFLIVDGAIRGSKYERMKTGVTKDGILRITDDGTGSMGSNWEIFTDGDAVELAEEYETSSGFFTATQVRQVYDLRAVSAGNAMVFVKNWNCGSYDYIDIYSVTVDDDLQITYYSRRADCLFSHERDAVLYRTTKRPKTKLTYETFRDLTWYICGEWSSSDTPSEEELDGMNRIDFFGSDYYFDTDSGIVYIIEQRSHDDDECRTMTVDEWALPMLREKLG